MGDEFVNLFFRAIGADISSDAEYAEPQSAEMTIRGKKLVDYHPSVLPGNMTKVIVPSGIKTIGDGCFTGANISHNDYMEGCILPEGVTELEDHAFALCRALTEISIPSTLKKIGNEAFIYSGIKSIELPEGLESIGDCAFQNCRSLKELRIPSTVEHIGENCFAFMGVPLLDFMSDGNSCGVLHMPSSLKSVYSEEYLAGYSGNLTIKWYDDGKKPKAKAAEKSTVPAGSADFGGGRREVLNGVLRVPVPDGYHYGSNTGSGNENWHYIVPEDTSLFDDHINAKPFGFGITAIPTAPLGSNVFDSTLAEQYEKLLLNAGALKAGSAVNTLIISAHCAFFYQCWTGDTDFSYHKLNGFLFAGSNGYTFHVVSNYDSPIAYEPNVVNDFTTAALSWMGNVSFIGDTPYSMPDIDDVKESVRESIESFADITGKYKHLLGVDLDYKTEFRTNFLTLGAMLYRSHGKKFTASAVSQLADMIGDIDGKSLTAELIRDILKKQTAGNCDVRSYLQSYDAAMLLRQLVKLDKMTNAGDDVSLVRMYSRIVDLMLQVLCEKSKINFAESDYYRRCVTEARLAFDEISKSIDVHVIPKAKTAKPVLGTVHSPSSSSGTAKAKKRQKASSADFEIESSGTLIKCNNKAAKKIVIPEGVVKIGENAFAEFDRLEEVVFPSSLRVIGEYAFFLCKNLRKVDLPEGLETIEPYAFDSAGIEEIKLPSTILNFDGGFFECRDLKKVTLPDGIESLKEGAFCFTGIEEINLPDSIREIGDEAFSECSFTKIILPKNIRKIGKRAFDCNELIEITIPDGCEEIGDECFADCKNLQKVYIPSSVSKIGESLFKIFGTSMAVIYTPRGSKADEYARRNGIPVVYTSDNAVQTAKPVSGTVHSPSSDSSTPKVKKSQKSSSADFEIESGVLKRYKGSDSKVTVPEGVIEIGEGAFEVSILDSISKDINLEEVSLPGTVRKIGVNAFWHCDSLKSINIPQGVNSIGVCAFSGCKSLKEIILPDGLREIEESAFSECESLTSVVIPDGVEVIEAGAFSRCKVLRKVDLPSTLRVIGGGVFDKGGLTEIIIPDGCESIGKRCFDSSYNLKRIFIPASVSEIGDEVFRRCDDVVVYTPRGSKAEEHAIENGLRVEYADDASELEKESTEEIVNNAPTKQVTLPKGIKSIDSEKFSYDERIESVVIPEGVEEIESYAFAGCTNLKTINLPDSIRKIGDNAFFNCESLTSIAIPEGVELIDSETFSDCINLCEASLPSSLRKIGDYAFDCCESLTNIIIPQGVNCIGGDAFSGCKSLKEIILPDGLREIEESAFSSCESLTSVVISEGVETIGPFAFYGCRMLRHVDLPSTLRKIDREAFQKCGLTEIIIPDGCESIGNGCFDSCYNLKSIFIPSSVSEIGEEVFWELSHVTIHTPRGSKAEEYARKNGIPVVYTSDNAVQTAKPVSGTVHSPSSTTRQQPSYNANTSPSTPQTKSYSIKYIPNGGDGCPPVQTKKHGEVVLISQYRPTKVGYTFRGWGESPNSQRVDYYPGSAYMVNKDITLYALWKCNTPENTKPGVPLSSGNTSSVASTYKPAHINTSQKQSEGCYIATAVYGSYDAPEVMTLRRFRDETLRNTAFGRWFIRMYYRFSPPVAERLKYAKHINAFVRSILDRFVNQLNKKQY